MVADVSTIVPSMQIFIQTLKNKRFAWFDIKPEQKLWVQGSPFLFIFFGDIHP
jgi:hypothetical protein